MIIEIFVNDMVKNRSRGVSQSIQVAPERHQVALELRRDILPDAARANAVAHAVVAVPILVLENIVDIVFIVGSKTVGAELPFALVVDVFSFLALK